MVRFLARPEKRHLVLKSVSFDGRLRFDSWKMGLVDQIIVSCIERLVSDFLYSRKAKTSRSFELNCFLIQSHLIFQGRFRFDSWSVQKATFEICFKRTPQVRFLKDVFGWWYLKKNVTLVFDFLHARKRKPAVLLNQLFFFSIIPFFKDASGSIPWRVQKKRHFGFEICFIRSSSGSIPERRVWLIRW